MDKESTSCSNNFPNENLEMEKLNIKDEAEEAVLLDRLSDLPEPLLVQIISLLETKEAVKTGVLSKKWKNLWTHVDSIVIVYEPENDNYEVEVPNLFSFVDNILMHCNSPKIKKFHLCFLYDGPGKEILLKWIQSVYKKNVEYLSLEVFNVYGETPGWFFRNPSLIKLRVDLFTMGISCIHAVSWNSLKSLCLFEVTTNDEQLAQILLGSPLLESLELRRVMFITRIDVKSPSLKTLRLFDVTANEEYEPFEINAPWLHQLQISGEFFGLNCRLLDVSSLKKAEISFTHSDSDDVYFDGTGDVRWLFEVYELLRSVQNVKELIIGPVLIQALSALRLLSKPSPLFKCKHLTVCLSIVRYDLLGMGILLQSSPHLETLSIKVLNEFEYYFRSYFDQIRDQDIWWCMQRGKLQHLRNIEVVYTTRYCYQKDEGLYYHKTRFDFELLKYLLCNASILKKLVITSEEKSLCGKDECACFQQSASRQANSLCRSVLARSFDTVPECRFRKRGRSTEFIYL